MLKLLEDKITLSDLEKDVLKEIGNICAGNAATALFQLLDKKIEMAVPGVFFVKVEDVPKLVGGEEKLIVGVVSQVLGDAPGVILLLFSQKDAAALAGILNKKRHKSKILSDMDQSAIKEVGHILSAAYLNTLSTFTNMGFIPSTPGLVVDMAGALVDYVLIELSTVTEYALLVDSEFIEAETKIKGHFFLLANKGSLEAILRAIGDYNETK